MAVKTAKNHETAKNEKIKEEITMKKNTRDMLNEAMKEIAVNCPTELFCRTGLPCEFGMNCRGGEQNTPCGTPYYAPITDYEQQERLRERRFLAMFARLSPEDMALVKQMQEKGFNEDEEAALEKALAKLKEVGRPICPRDFLEVINRAIRERIRAWKKSESVFQSSLLVAAVLSRNLLMDLILEEETDEKHSA